MALVFVMALSACGGSGSPAVPQPQTDPAMVVTNLDELALQIATGNEYVVNLQVSNPSTETLALIFNWGDGSAPESRDVPPDSKTDANIILATSGVAPQQFTFTKIYNNGTTSVQTNKWLAKLLNPVQKILVQVAGSVTVAPPPSAATPSLVSVGTPANAIQTGSYYNLAFRAKDTDGDLAVMSLKWNDESEPRLATMEGSAAEFSFSRIFTQAGTYTWTAQVRDAGGRNSDTLTGPVTVTVPVAIPTPSAPTLALSGTPLDSLFTQTAYELAFDGADKDGDLKAIVLRWSDEVTDRTTAISGATVNGAKFSRTFTQAGTFTWTAKAVDEGGRSSTPSITGQVKVSKIDTLPPDYDIVFFDHFDTDNIGAKGQQLWTYREGPRLLWNGFTAYNRADNVQVQDGVLKINFTQDVDQFIGGGITSNQNFGYGYYGAKIRFYTGTAGLHQSFWTYSTTEIDAVEMNSNDGNLTNNLHKWVPGDPSLHSSSPSSGKTKLPIGPSTFLSDWVHVGVLYEEGKVTFFINGLVDRSIDKASFSSFPTYDVGKIWLTALPTKAITPMANARMEVDWVYYARSRTDKQKNLVSNNDFSIHAPVSITGTPHTSILGWSTGSAGGKVPNVADLNYSRLHRNTVFADKGTTPASTQWLLEHRNRNPRAAPWNTNTFQAIPYPANGKYYVRIRYKSSTRDPENYASQLILRDDKNEVLKLVLEDNTNGLWVDRYIGLDDDSINLQNASPTLNLIIRSEGRDLSDQLWVDFVGLYKKSD